MKSFTYISRRIRQGAGGISELHDILSVSVRNNSRWGLTGMLFATDFLFVQYLEGESPNFEKIADKIIGDKRQRDLAILSIDTIEKRRFPSWSMQFSDIDFDAHRKLLSIANPTSFGRHDYADEVTALLQKISPDFDKFMDGIARDNAPSAPKEF